MQVEKITMIPYSSLIPNGLNPRTSTKDSFKDLQSIVIDGQLNIKVPLIVRKYKDDKFEIVEGHRRYAATGEAIKLKKVSKDSVLPAIIRNLSDDEALQTMFIINMQRLDLSDYEQAASFKAFLDKFEGNDDAVADLSIKTGINIQYIRRHASIMTLPSSVLDMWKSGKLSFGHLEQLLRVSPEDAVKLAKRIVEYRDTVAETKRMIENQKAILSSAIFDKKEAGCDTCKFSTKVQSGLFGSDFKADKIMCTDSKCYFEKQLKALETNWQKLPEVIEHKTNGYIIVTADNANALHKIYTTDKTKKDCKSCEKFVVALDEKGAVIAERCCKDPKCYKKLYEAGCKTSSTTTESSPKEKSEKKTENLAKDTAEVFYSEKLPGWIAQTPAGFNHARIQLMALIKSNPKACKEALKVNNIEVGEYGWENDLIEEVFTMKDDEVQNLIADISIQAIMSQRDFSLEQRIKIAEMFSLHIEKEFVMTEDYLKRKSKEQLVAMSKQFDIYRGVPDQDLLAKKKTEIVEKFLGKDLTGKIPDEITSLTVKKKKK